MKKKILCSIIATTIIFSMVGCAKKKVTNTPVNNTDVTTTVEVLDNTTTEQSTTVESGTTVSTDGETVSEDTQNTVENTEVSATDKSSEVSKPSEEETVSAKNEEASTTTKKTETTTTKKQESTTKKQEATTKKEVETTTKAFNMAEAIKNLRTSNYDWNDVLEYRKHCVEVSPNELVFGYLDEESGLYGGGRCLNVINLDYPDTWGTDKTYDFLPNRDHELGVVATRTIYDDNGHKATVKGFYVVSGYGSGWLEYYDDGTNKYEWVKGSEINPSITRDKGKELRGSEVKSDMYDAHGYDEKIKCGSMYVLPEWSTDKMVELFFYCWYE